MSLLRSFFLAALLCFWCAPTSSAIAAATRRKINHIIVLMEENRSFDHLMGYYNGTKAGVRNRTETNFVNRSLTPFNASHKHEVEKVVFSPTAPYINYCDPVHSYPATQSKIYGEAAWLARNFSDPTMGGFAQYEYSNANHTHTSKTDFCNVMQGMAPGKMPVLEALADNFVLFDQFHCSLPGPTWPNRMFFLSATSAGLTETAQTWYHDHIGSLFPQKTIMDQVAEGGGTWKLYYGDTPWELFMESIAHNPERLEDMSGFFHDAASGTLPNFAFINPRGGSNLTERVGCNDMHPDHDIRLGEQLYKDVYEALRASPQWNETLFVLVFDEHGGFYDHVKPISGIPNPGDGEKSYPDKDFHFDRAGMRIPMILASPWLPKQTVVSSPKPSQKPASNSLFEHTSVMATSRKLLAALSDAPPLTKRDAWAATFEDLFDLLDEPRTDCPTTLPKAPTPAKGGGPTADQLLKEETEMPINALQEKIMQVHGDLVDEPLEAASGQRRYAMKQGDFSKWAKERFHRHRELTAAWKESKSNISAKYQLVVQPSLLPCTANRWDIHWRSEDSVTHQNALEHSRVRGNDAAESAVDVGSSALLAAPSIDAASVGPHPTVARRMMLSPTAQHPPSTAYYQTVSIAIPTGNTNTTYCLDANAIERFSRIGISTCYPSADPMANRDVAQHWVVSKTDSTLRPAADTSLCATTRVNSGSPRLTLDVCTGRVEQHFSYETNAPGSRPAGAFYLRHGFFYGIGVNGLVIVTV